MNITREPVLLKSMMINTSSWKQYLGIPEVFSTKSYEEYSDGITNEIVENRSYRYAVAKEFIDDLGDDVGLYLGIVEKKVFLDNYLPNTDYALFYETPQGSATPILPNIHFEEGIYNYSLKTDKQIKETIENLAKNDKTVSFQLRRDWRIYELSDFEHCGVNVISGRFAWVVVPNNWKRVR